MAGTEGKGELLRLTVVLDEALLEHVRLRAFQERKSRSAYVRELVERDAREPIADEQAKGARS